MLIFLTFATQDSDSDDDEEDHDDDDEDLHNASIDLPVDVGNIWPNIS